MAAASSTDAPPAAAHPTPTPSPQGGGEPGGPPLCIHPPLLRKEPGEGGPKGRVGGISRESIVAEARAWIGTPYRHQASVKGVGCDCLGLVRGVWRALYGSEAEAVPAYSSDWGQATGEETMLLAARRHLVAVDRDCLEPGNVVVFRMHGRAIAKHAGIFTGKGRFVHAYQPMRVTENWLDGWWGKRIAAVFEFPGVSLRPTPSPSPSPSPGPSRDRSDLGGGGKR